MRVSDNWSIHEGYKLHYIENCHIFFLKTRGQILSFLYKSWRPRYNDYRTNDIEIHWYEKSGHLWGNMDTPFKITEYLKWRIDNVGSNIIKSFFGKG